MYIMCIANYCDESLHHQILFKTLFHHQMLCITYYVCVLFTVDLASLFFNVLRSHSHQCLKKLVDKGWAAMLAAKRWTCVTLTGESDDHAGDEA